MPHNFTELENLLARSSDQHRRVLGELIGCGFGNTPSLICDHLNFLRAGAIGQAFDRRDYKKLVTDVADHVGISWATLVADRTWHQLAAYEIEAAIVAHIGDRAAFLDDVQQHLAPTIRTILRTIIAARIPAPIALRPMVGDALDRLLLSLKTDWGRLTAAVVFVHCHIRPDAASQIGGPITTTTPTARQ